MKTLAPLLLCLLLISCKNDDIATAGERNAAKVSEQMALYKVERMIVTELRGTVDVTKYDGNLFKIEGQFVKVGGIDYWNLEYLRSFEFPDSKTIILRF